MNATNEPPETQRSTRTSPWAVGALVCCPLSWCPLGSLGALVLGLLGLRDIRRTGRRGRSAALAAVVFGAVTALAWLVGAVWWNANVRQPILEGPVPALQRGLAGDVEAFRAAFVSDPGSDPAAAASFLEAVRQRYGATVTASGQGEAGPLEGAVMQDGAIVVPYQIVFTGGAVNAEATFLMHRDGALVLRFSSMRLIDPDRGELVFPSPQGQR
ncbi:MAG: DUF4190 domain-containing protein [Planctomycetota bacterium]